MPYLYATSADDRVDLASGRVLEGAPGHPAFPVRLASEMYLRCAAIRRAQGSSGGVTLYDPCCGGATLITTVAYLHGEEIHGLLVSDADASILPLAERNLGLLTLHGMDRRIAQLSGLIERFGKDSHREALASAGRMRKRVEELRQARELTIRTFPANALCAEELAPGLRSERIDLVITDVPYGAGSSWHVAGPARLPPIEAMLEALRPLLAGHAVVAVCADKGQAARHEAYRRVERFGIGKRRVAILQPLEG